MAKKTVKSANKPTHASMRIEAERRQIDESLKYRNALLEAQNEATPDGILTVDAKGKILSFNQHFVELWKIPAHITRAKDDSAALRFAMTQLVDPQGFMARVNYLYSHQDESSHEEIYFKDGRVFDRYGLPVTGDDRQYYGWAWHFRDITVQKQAEKQFQRQNEYLTALNETALETSKGLSDQFSILKIILSRATKLAQTPNGYIYLLDETHSELTVHIATGVFRQYVGHALKKGEGLAGRVWKTGKYLTISNYDTWSGRQANFPKGLLKAAVALPLYSGSQIIGVIALGYDTPKKIFLNEEVTALKRLADLASMALDNTRLYQESQEREKHFKSMVDQQTALVELNEAKDEFISLASHQLRTPATGVKQFIGMLLDNYFGKMTTEQRAMLEYAYESNERQLHVINDLLKVAKIDAGKVVLNEQKYDLANMLEDIMQEQRSQFAKRNQKVFLDRPTKPVVAKVDPSRMRMVIENLIDNASKYTPDGKRIDVSINRSLSGKYVTVKVKDEGVGMLDEDLPKLFQKFSRLDNPLSIQVGGTGIGLYWAKKIVDLHGGDIMVKSKLSKGTTFTVKIPA